MLFGEINLERKLRLWLYSHKLECLALKRCPPAPKEINLGESIEKVFLILEKRPLISIIFSIC